MTTVIQTPKSSWAKLFDYCQKSFTCMKHNPGLFWMRKLARFEFFRGWIIRFFRHSNLAYELNQANPSVFQGIKVESLVSALRTDSYALGINLPQDIIQEILNYAHSAPCYAERNPNAKFYYREKEKVQASLGKEVRLGSYFNAEGCAVVRKLEHDPGLLAIAAKFLEAPPIHIATELWWSFPVTGTLFEQLKAAQVFHYDLDDYRFIKFFFYLTDVDECTGPHVLLRGSHKNKKFSHQLLGVRCASKDDKEIVEYYGTENLVTICGSAGLGFAEDSTCFHKGTSPSGKERLLLQIEYAINHYGDIRSMAS